MALQSAALSCVLLGSPVWAQESLPATFGPPEEIRPPRDPSGQVHSIATGDLDGDGDLDLVTGSIAADEVAWFRNDGTGTFGEAQILTQTVNGVHTVAVADLDGDGDLDIVSASRGDDKLAFYENLDGAGTFGPEMVISTEADGIWFVHPADLDGDGDIDLVTSSRDDDQVAWFENDGSGAFSGKKVISTQIDFGRSVCTADIDGDGKLDVISASAEDDKIAWYRHLDGEGTFGSQRIVTLQADGAVTVKAGDIDGDGDPDLLVASANDHTVAWYENTLDGEQWTQHILTGEATGADGAALADLDSDGDLDVIGSGMETGLVEWFENTDGQGTFGEGLPLSDQEDGVADVTAADLDGDGDLDVLSAAWRSDRIAVIQNSTALIPIYEIRQTQWPDVEDSNCGEMHALFYGNAIVSEWPGNRHRGSIGEIQLNFGAGVRKYWILTVASDNDDCLGRIDGFFQVFGDGEGGGEASCHTGLALFMDSPILMGMDMANFIMPQKNTNGSDGSGFRICPFFI